VEPLDALLLALAVSAASTSAPLVREALAPALLIALWRNLLASVVLAPGTYARHRDELRALDRRERRLIVVAGVLLAGHFATWIPSLSYTTVASSVALVCMQPVWSATLAHHRGEPVGARTWAGIAIALVGVVALTGVDFALSGRAVFGDALALVGGALAAAYVTVGGAVRQSVSTTVYTAGCYSAASAALFVACVVGRVGVVPSTARTWWCLVALTVGPQLLGHSVMNRLLRTISPTMVSTALLFEIVGSAVLAYWWFGESPPAGTYPAAALIAAGVVLVVNDVRRR
jgi:drug/metabolite transporter (DMT)-like permease